MHGPIKYTFYQRPHREQEGPVKLRSALLLAGEGGHVSLVPESGCSFRTGVERLPATREWSTVGRRRVGKKQIDLSAGIARFGDILNIEGPLVEIGPRSVFANSAVNRSIFSICNALHQGGLLTLPDVPPSVCYPSGRHRQRRRPKPGGQRNLDPRIGRERASRHGDCQHHGGRGPAVRDRSTQVKC